MPKSRSSSLQQVLRAHHGVPPEEVRWWIYCGVFPVWSRCWRNTRLYLGADPFDAEYRFVLLLAEARSPSDVERALEAYRDEVARQAGLTRLLIRSWPSRERALQYFERIMSVLTAGASAQKTEMPGVAGV